MGRRSARSTTGPTADLWEDFNAWVVAQGAPPLPDLEFVHDVATYANLYVFPEEADYTDRRPLDPTWHRMDSSVRATDGAGRAARRRWPTGPPAARLVYLSLGLARQRRRRR